MTSTKHTDAGNTRKSRKTRVRKPAPPSVLDAVPPSEMSHEMTSFGINSGVAIAMLVAIIHAAYRNHPSPDYWDLVLNHAKLKTVEELGFSEAECDQVIEKLLPIFDNAHTTSPWPKGFF